MLTLEDAWVRLGSADILRGVSLHVARGESVALVGESGAGKSTLGRVLLRLQNLSRGRYEFAGTDVTKLRGSQLRLWRRDVQAVFQDPVASLDPRMRIGHQVIAPMVVRGLARRDRADTAARLLESVGLPKDVARRYPHEVSGGQCQRVAIARAMSVEPSMVVMDEPVSGLDMSMRGQVLNLMRKQTKAVGSSMVYITHDLDTVSRLCDRVYVLYEGRIVEELQGDNMIEQATDGYTASLIEAILSVDERRV
jgi:ABC-type glutathione transport system ATPase component